MKPASARLFAAVFLAFGSLAPLAHAQQPAGLSEVQKAYAAVDYQKTQSLAEAAIRHGGNDRASSAELYRLWATACAALDQPDDARKAFAYALAANPELKLDRSLSPKIRAPYLEARGAMPTGDGTPLDLSLRLGKQALELSLHDALEVAAGVVVSMRAVGTVSFSRRRFDAAPTRSISVPLGSDLEVSARVVDTYDNVLFELGSEEQPQRLMNVSGSRPGAPSSGPARDANPLPYYVTSGALAVLGAAAGGVATVMYVRREDAARQWNGPTCEHPGQTRAEQCSSVNDRRLRDERLAIGLTAAGGALLVGSIVSFVLAPSSRTNVALSAGPGDVTLRLRTAL